MHSRSMGSGSDSTGSEYNERMDDSDLQSEWPRIRPALAKALCKSITKSKSNDYSSVVCFLFN